MACEAIPEMNKTSLGLYVMPKEAYAMWQANPETVHILDVRTLWKRPLDLLKSIKKEKVK